MWTSVAFAGLGPHQVVVLYNADEPRSGEVASAYADARALPEGHLCGLSGLDPAVTQLDTAAFTTQVLAPFEACRDALPHPEDISAIVTVRGLPLVVTLPNYVVGLEAALQVGRGTGPGGEIVGSGQISPSGFAQASVENPAFVAGGCFFGDLALSNPYAGWYDAMCGLQRAAELPPPFDRSDPWTSGGYDLTGELYVVTRLDGFDHDDALDLVDRAVAADGAFPSAPVVCMQGADEARAARDPECELTTRRLDEAGVPAIWISPHDPALAGLEVSAYFTGADNLRGAIDGVTYAPGAVACNLTSYGAVPQNFVCDEATGVLCPASESQTSIARFVRAGATAAHGTVAEPLNNVFPNAGALALYTSGYTLGESFLYTQRYLYWQNLLLGDPLVAPFAERPVVELPTEVGEDGTVVVTASHPDGIEAVALYVDGVRVAVERADRLEWSNDRSEGESVSLYAVAVAGPTTLNRPGWPLAGGTQLARTGTQGWVALEATVGAVGATEPTGDDDDDDDDDTTTTDTDDTNDDGDPKSGGCGCATTRPSAAAWLVVVAAFLSRRRSVVERQP